MTQPVSIPLSVSGDAVAFAAALASHRAALAAHRIGPAGVAAPVAPPWIDSLVARVTRSDPLSDSFDLLPYMIVDDTPRAPAVATALAVLRETLA